MKVVSFQFNCKNTLHSHIITNIVKISLKRVKMNFCPGSKNSIQGKDRKILQNCLMLHLSTIVAPQIFCN